MKKKLRISLVLALLVSGAYLFISPQEENEIIQVTADITEKKEKKSVEERQLYSIERELHEFNLQKNPITGDIPIIEKEKELQNSLQAMEDAANRVTSSTYVSRGPTNVGGRTRAMVVDISDATSNTILSGGVSSGLFRTTNGGTSWTKVSSNNDIHNVTALAQDPRAGFQNIWYYGTGEWSGNSAGLGSAYRGRGIWKSIDGGLTWAQISATDSPQEIYDPPYDYIMALEVSPLNGDLLIAATGKIIRFDGTNLSIEVEESANGTGWTDVTIATDGTVYAAIEGTSTENGVWTSTTGNGSWTRIAQNATPTGWSSAGRLVLATAPSNSDIVYALYVNGMSGLTIQADLWQYDAGGAGTWTDYSSVLPDELGGNLAGNDPFTTQGGYDIVVSVKPNDENFVVIGGTNAYKIADITSDPTFLRIGGYNSNANYALYPTHHPDVHVLEFDPNNNDVLFSGTDGGVHRTADINAGTVAWTNLNNDYQTYQYYHVAMDNTDGSNAVIGGAQDNGTTIGGTDLGLPDNTTTSSFFGGDGVAVGITRRNAGANFQLYYGSQSGNARTNYPGFRAIAPAGSTSQFVTYFYLDPHSTNAMYFAGQTTMYRTNDAENVTTAVDASNWVNMGGLATFEAFRTFATSPGAYNPASSYMLIGGQNGGVFRLDDPQNKNNLVTAVNITPAGASTAAGSIVSGFGVHPNDPDTVLVVYANYGITNIYLTTNATDPSPTWTLVERNLSSHSIRSAAIADVGPETIYLVGTARGLYSSDDPTSNDWDLEGVNEMGLALISSLVHRASDNRLLIGTHGNGMYETTVEGSLSLPEVDLESGLSIYPNPTQSILNFKGNNFDFGENTNYYIADITGKIINKGTINDRKLDVSALSSGVYFIGVNANGSQEVLKFIKK